MWPTCSTDEPRSGVPEVRLGRRLDPVRALAEVDRVQVLREDPRPCRLALELDREHDLAAFCDTDRWGWMYSCRPVSGSVT